MPSTIVKTIKSLLTGDTIYPVTKASAVYMNDSTSQSPSTAEGHITALDSKVGTATLDTTAQDLCTAINQHEIDINELNSNLSEYFEGESKIVTTNNNEVFLRVRGKIATLVINVSSILDQTFAVIPEGYRSMPNLTFVGRYKTGSNYYPALITVNGSGNINASYFNGTTVAAITSGTIVGSFTYVIS